MRLSDVKGERVFDVIADIIVPIANIAEDKKATELFTRKKLPEGMTPKSFLLQRAKEAVPALLKGHKSDLVAILSTIEGISAEQYLKTLNLTSLFKDCVDLLTDEVFKELFISAQSENSSGSASESTEARKA